MKSSDAAHLHRWVNVPSKCAFEYRRGKEMRGMAWMIYSGDHAGMWLSLVGRQFGPYTDTKREAMKWVADAVAALDVGNPTNSK